MNSSGSTDSVRSASDRRATDAAKCSECDKPNATLWCQNCNVSLCKKCFDKAHQLKVSKSHRVMSVVDRPQKQAMCGEHDQPLILWCDRDQVGALFLVQDMNPNLSLAYQLIFSLCIRTDAYMCVLLHHGIASRSRDEVDYGLGDAI